MALTLRKLLDQIVQERTTLVSKARRDSLDELRYSAGFIAGLECVAQILEKEESNAQDQERGGAESA